MKAQTKKWVHAGLVAFFAAWTDLGAQLAMGGFSLTRAVLVGVIMGGIGRVAGAMLGAVITSDGDAPDEGESHGVIDP
jgi:ABC-type branched-subunit amino acid transport system permease subunit